MRIVLIDSSLMFGKNIGLASLVSTTDSRNKVKVVRPFANLIINRYGEALDKASGNVADISYGGSFMREIDEFAPEVIGFSSTSFTFNRSLSIAAFLRPRYPGISFIWGGVHPTLLPEETIRNPLVDAICIGEGEKSFPEYLAKLEKNENPDVDGIWYKDKSGQIVRNRLRPFEEDLDALPFPDWDRFNVSEILKRDLYYMPGSLSILSSRGCPYDCSFCSNAAISKSVPGRYYRVRSPDNVIVEIKYNEKKYGSRGFRNIHFADEIFGLDIKWLRGFCNEFKKESLHRRFSWCCATRADLVTAEWAKTVAEAGCKWVWLGVESGNDYIRQVVYKKDIKKEDIVRAVSSLKKNKINVGFYLMVGCPEESIKSIFSSVMLIFKTRPASFHYMRYIPLPRTELSKRVETEMWIRDRELRDYWNAPRIATTHLGFNKMNITVWLIRLLKISWLFMQGLKMKGISFIWDTLSYFFLGSREVNLFSPYLLSDFEQKTILRYRYLEKLI